MNDILLQRSDRHTAESVDIPFSVLGHKLIGSAHLTLGLLRLEGCPATYILRLYGIESDTYPAKVGKAAALPQTVPAETIQVAPWLRDTVAALERYADVYGEQRILWKPRTLKSPVFLSQDPIVFRIAAQQVSFA